MKRYNDAEAKLKFAHELWTLLTPDESVPVVTTLPLPAITRQHYDANGSVPIILHVAMFGFESLHTNHEMTKVASAIYAHDSLGGPSWGGP